jgi:antitoxin ParD1/3/4
MNISLPESMRDWVETQAKLGGHANVNVFVERVLCEEKQRLQEEIDELLMEGLQSGEPIEITENFWNERRRTLDERMRTPAKESA